MSVAAAEQVAATLRRVIAERGQARIVVATAASQLEFQRALVAQPGVDWSRVEVFQLDEYIGLPAGHPASFRRLLYDNVIEHTAISTVHLIGDAGDPTKRAALNERIASVRIDLAILGIGENAHLAFNDPPADFETTDPYVVVELDQVCRQQQVGEGWFASLADVPTRAVSMSIGQMLKAEELVVIVPDKRKAAAVKASIEGDVTPMVPASILRTHGNATLYLDDAAASELAK
jgi:glucosamine-6-phosphate deaminase